jgi:hypothetical protein
MEQRGLQPQSGGLGMEWGRGASKEVASVHDPEIEVDLVSIVGSDRVTEVLQPLLGAHRALWKALWEVTTSDLTGVELEKAMADGQALLLESHLGDGPCPECVQSKHANCDDQAWDTVLDVQAKCPCAEVGHLL